MKDPEKRLSEQIIFRVTPPEFEAIENLAKRLNTTKSAMIRQAVKKMQQTEVTTADHVLSPKTERSKHA